MIVSSIMLGKGDRYEETYFDRTLGSLILAAGIGAGGWYYYTHHAGSARGSDTVYVTKISKLSEMDSGVENRYAGVVEPQETVQVKIESGRKVKEVQVKTGQEVKKGQLLFQYDLGSIQQSLQEAQLALGPPEKRSS